MAMKLASDTKHLVMMHGYIGPYSKKALVRREVRKTVSPVFLVEFLCNGKVM